MKIFIVIAEHPEVPGTVIKPFKKAIDANTEARDCVKLMWDDTPAFKRRKFPENWESAIETLQGYHGAAFCTCYIAERDLA